MKRILVFFYALLSCAAVKADALSCPTCGDCWDALTPDLTRCRMVMLNSATFSDFRFYIRIEDDTLPLQDSMTYKITSRQASVWGELKNGRGKTRPILFSKDMYNQAVTILSVDETDAINGTRWFTIRCTKETLEKKIHSKGKAHPGSADKTKQSSMLYGYAAVSVFSLFLFFLRGRKRPVTAAGKHQE